MGFSEPTPIQLRAFPIVLAGKDLIGTAQTGTGKTAAFALPILTLLAKHGGLRCLVLEPTRELAAQVETAFRDYGRFTDLRVTVVHGGVGYGKQREELKRGVDILVATPGRLLDLLEQRTMSFKEIKILVLDEVDRMLDMGFLPDVRRIVEKISTKRQTLLFSATLPPEIERLAAWVLRDPELVEIGVRRSPAETVTHAVYPVAAEQKFDLLMALLERTNFDSALIFCRTKYGADRIAHQLKQGKHAVAVLHSNRTQRERIEALEGFKSGKYEVMVATDIASRGTRHRRRESRDQLRCARASGRLRPSDRAHGTGAKCWRRLHTSERPGVARVASDRTFHRPENSATEAGEFLLPIHGTLRVRDGYNRREERRRRQAPTFAVTPTDAAAS